MKVFIAGATGVIGRPLVRRLVELGHGVVAMTRRPEAAAQLAAQGAEPVVCDVYDVSTLERAVDAAAADVLVHQLTALPRAIDPRKIAVQLAENDRVRVEGTRNLVQAATRAGIRRVVAQSIAFAYAPTGGLVKSEQDPLWLDAPWPWKRSVEAVARLEQQVTSAAGPGGVVLRYGFFYGPRTVYAADGSMAELVRARRFPIGGAGSGVFSFVHVEDAVAATVCAVEGQGSGIYNVVDDEPAAQREWLPVYAEALGARSPMRVPGFLARLGAGRYGHYMLTRQRGASNVRAKRELDWSPRFDSWRTGFATSLREAAPVEPGTRAVSHA